MPVDQSGLRVTINESESRLHHSDSVASAIHLKLFPLVDIIGAKTDLIPSPMGQIFTVRFITRDDAFLFEMVRSDAKIWFTRVQDLISFAHVPAPGSRVDTETGEQINSRIANDDASLTISTRISPFALPLSLPSTQSALPSSSSGKEGVFVIPSETSEILRNMQIAPLLGLTVVTDLSNLLQEVLKNITLVKSNKAVAKQFGLKLCLIIYKLNHPVMGIFTKVTSNQSTVLLYQIALLSPPILEARNFLEIQRMPGWLTASVDQNIGLKYQILDKNISIAVMNLFTSLAVDAAIDMMHGIIDKQVDDDKESSNIYDDISVISDVYDSAVNVDATVKSIGNYS